MAQLPSDFDSDANDEVGIFTIPKGTYFLELFKNTIKKTANRKGKLLTLSFKVTQGNSEGRKFDIRLNIVNPNPTTVNIAKSHITALRKACGFVDPVDDMDELMGIEFVAEVGIQKGSEGFSDSNVIHKYQTVESYEEEMEERRETQSDDSPFEDD